MSELNPEQANGLRMLLPNWPIQKLSPIIDNTWIDLGEVPANASYRYRLKPGALITSEQAAICLAINIEIQEVWGGKDPYCKANLMSGWCGNGCEYRVPEDSDE